MNYRFRLLIRLRPVLRFVKFRILHVEDSPQRIARGIAIGVFFAFLPLLGLQMLLALLAAAVTKANKAIALVSTWISNPLTAMVIFYPCYRIGRVVLSWFRSKPEIDVDQLETILEEQLSLWEMLYNLFSYDYWKQLASVFARIGVEIFIGGVILGALAGGAVYWVAYYFILGYRSRKENRKNNRFQLSE